MRIPTPVSPMMGLPLVFLLIVLLSPNSRAQDRNRAADLTEFRILKVAVMPFFKGRYGGSVGETLDTRLSHLQGDPGNFSGDPAAFLTRLTQEEMNSAHGGKVVSPVSVEAAMGQLEREGQDGDTPRTLAQRLGNALGANAVAGGYVWKWRDRVGGGMAAEMPAAVAFAVWLIDVETGGTLWRETFEETQKSLSENILDAKAFLRRGGKWLSADDLARYGMAEIFKKYPYRGQ
jgi:hypothetical protein